MAKSKNHTTHNQNYKNHRNGIKKPQRQKYINDKGVNAKYLRNRKRAIKFDPKQNKHIARYVKSKK
jgi:large subunit ribosomal protein L29e